MHEFNQEPIKYMEVGGGGEGGGGKTKLTADLYSQVKFIDNLFRRHPLESSNYLFSFEFYFVATFTNVLVFIFPAHYSEKRLTGCPSKVNQLQKT